MQIPGAVGENPENDHLAHCCTYTTRDSTNHVGGLLPVIVTSKPRIRHFKVGTLLSIMCMVNCMNRHLGVELGALSPRLAPAHEGFQDFFDACQQQHITNEKKVSANGWHFDQSTSTSGEQYTPPL